MDMAMGKVPSCPVFYRKHKYQQQEFKSTWAIVDKIIHYPSIVKSEDPRKNGLQFRRELAMVWWDSGVGLVVEAMEGKDDGVK